jgi:hypothetical protein
MKAYFDRLNSSERRLIVGVGLILFLAVNVFFIWPRFSDWNAAKARMTRATTDLTRYRTAIAQLPALQRQLQQFQGETDVPEEDQSIQFQTMIGREAAQHGVAVVGYRGLVTRTNDPFFLEQMQTISFQSEEKQLVDFLYNMGSSSSMIRVRGLGIRPDPPRQRLTGTVTLVASHQKKIPTRPAAQRPARRTTTTTR